MTHVSNRLHPDLPPTPGIVATMITDGLDALSGSPDPQVQAWLKAVYPFIPKDFGNFFGTRAEDLSAMYDLPDYVGPCAPGCEACAEENNPHETAERMSGAFDECAFGEEGG